MALRSTFVPSMVIILSFIAYFKVSCHTSFEYDPQVVHLHDVLTSFTRRGQTTIELFAPLSTVVGSTPDGLIMLTVAAHIVWSILGVVFLKMLRVHELVHSFRTRMVLYGLIVGMAAFPNSGKPEHLISTVQHHSLSSGNR